MVAKGFFLIDTQIGKYDRRVSGLSEDEDRGKSLSINGMEENLAADEV